MDIVPLDILGLATVAFLGAMVFGITGFGSALVTIPLSAFFVPLPFALALFSLLDLTSAVRVGFRDPGNAVRREWTRIVPMILVGTVLGVTLLVNLPRRTVMFALAAFVVAMGVSTFTRRGAGRAIGEGWAYAAGLGGGLTSTLFGAGGPPYAIYLSRRGLTKEQYRATLSRCIVFSISMRVVAFIASGLLSDWRVWLTALLAFPGSWLGITLATRLAHRMSREILMRIVALVLIATGVSLAVRAQLMP